jgi:hypothetical protein
MSISSAWAGVIALAVFLVFVGVRLGYKVTTTTETDIIDHYVGEFLSEMAAHDHVADSSACHGEVGQTFWERIVVKCAHPNGGTVSYRTGHWGQLIGRARRMGDA